MFCVIVWVLAKAFILQRKCSPASSKHLFLSLVHEFTVPPLEGNSDSTILGFSRPQSKWLITMRQKQEARQQRGRAHRGKINTHKLKRSRVERAWKMSPISHYNFLPIFLFPVFKNQFHGPQFLKWPPYLNTLALGQTDLRGHFSAQLRALIRERGTGRLQTPKSQGSEQATERHCTSPSFQVKFLLIKPVLTKIKALVVRLAAVTPLLWPPLPPTLSPFHSHKVKQDDRQRCVVFAGGGGAGNSLCSWVAFRLFIINFY